MSELTRIDRAVIVATTTVLAAVMLPATAMAGPGAQGKGKGKGPPPHAGSGNPHAPGQTGKPHRPGQRGNPHRGSPPYGRALGYQGGAGQQGSVGAGAAAALDSHGATRSQGRGKGKGKGNPDRPPGKSTICHRTKSETNPFEKITVPNTALEGHANHGDVEPAPDGSCRASNPPLDPESPPGTEKPGDRGQVLGEESSPPAASVAEEPTRGTLPVTGLAAITLACIGIVVLMLGFVARALNGDPRRADS